MSKKYLFASIFFWVNSTFSQTYSYYTYLNDKFIQEKIRKFTRNHQTDSIKVYASSYKNRLGFLYYQCQALISKERKYLDSAFMKGMTPLCIKAYINEFDSIYVYESFKKNYLKSYNISLINLIDSIHYQDQKYRQLINIERQKANTVISKNSIDNKSSSIKSSPKILDSLWQLQNFADSSNFLALNEIIKKYGWPSAKLVGEFYCQRPSPDVTMIISHLGTKKKEYQVNTLRQVINLCEKQEDSWQNAEALIFNLHLKFSRDFSQLSFIEITDGHLDREESFFSIYNLSKIFVNSLSNYRLEIECKSEVLFNEFKNVFIESSKLVPVESSLAQIRKELGQSHTEVNETSIRYIPTSELKDNIILYKIIRE